jgi:hypothetical protein
VLKYDLVPRVGMTHQFVPLYVHGSCYTSESYLYGSLNWLFLVTGCKYVNQLFCNQEMEDTYALSSYDSFVLNIIKMHVTLCIVVVTCTLVSCLFISFCNNSWCVPFYYGVLSYAPLFLHRLVED